MYVVEEYFIEKVMVDVKVLKDINLEYVFVLDDFDFKKNLLFILIFYKKLFVKDVVVGFFLLIKVGEVCFINIYIF